MQQNRVQVTGSAAAGVVAEVDDRAAFVAMEREWDELVAATDDQFFYRHSFLRVWIDNFAPGEQLRVLTLRDDDGRLDAVLPLVARRSSLYGVPVRMLAAPANTHSCRFDLIARDREAAAAAFTDHLAAERSWDVLWLRDVPEHGNGLALVKAAQARGMPAGISDSLQSPWISLPDSHEQLAQRLSSKFRANVRRRRRRLEERGKVTVERIQGGVALDGQLAEGFALEASGWKGEAGTAIAQDPATHGFYTELARNAADTGKLVLYLMRLDGRPIGFHYALEHGGHYLLLKPAYDEALGECSPGQLLMDEVLRDCIDRGLKVFDFLGPNMRWKRDWADGIRPHHFVHIFRDTPLGHALCKAKFRWLPAAKEKIRQWRQ